MTPEEFQAHYPQVIGWIRSTLQAHEGGAKSVASAGFVRLPLYFGQDLLEDCIFMNLFMSFNGGCWALNVFSPSMRTDWKHLDITTARLKRWRMMPKQYFLSPQKVLMRKS